ncbi:MAG: hypothetical protein JNL32_10805 [Candidatus Kapabacteria bacterium]|nr:hypothetical protein [Candidatus Kapabacteria bacterium]
MNRGAYPQCLALQKAINQKQSNTLNEKSEHHNHNTVSRTAVCEYDVYGDVYVVLEREWRCDVVA